MTDEIIPDRMDELGAFLLGCGLNDWWTAAQLDINGSRGLVPGQGAMTLQVAASVVLAEVIWMTNKLIKTWFCLMTYFISESKKWLSLILDRVHM